jgi:hypothetical protein
VLVEQLVAWAKEQERLRGQQVAADEHGAGREHELVDDRADHH